MEPLTPRALERRLKRHVLKETHDFLAVGAPGFEAALLAEVEALPNVSEARAVRGGVTFRGPLTTIYHANLRLATAHRVLWRVAEFLAQSYPMLFNKAAGLPWERFLGFEKSVRFSVSARASRLHHAPHIAATLLSAAQQALSPLGLNVQEDDEAALEIHVRLFRDRCTLSLNTSGAHLHRRGYRTHIGEAPLRETLAAAMLKQVGAPDFSLIVDPMCGSGTLLLEAARLLRRLPPGGERAFAFKRLPTFQPTLWERLKREAAAERQLQTATLLGFDSDPEVLKAAQANAARAGVEDGVRLGAADALTLPYDALKAAQADHGPHERALLVCNPPYGKRLGTRQSKHLYAGLSSALAAAPGWTFAILTPDPAWVTLPVSERLEFHNGGLEVTLLIGQT